jgi:hypothetical protein
MSYKRLSNGGGERTASTKKNKATQSAKPELGALKLDADEVAQFEKWMMGPNKPNTLMSAAAQTHRLLRGKWKGS